MSRRRLHPAERDELRRFVDVSGDVVRFEPAIAERDLADVVALLGEQALREVVRAVLAFADHEILSRTGWSELGGDEPGCSRHRRD